LVATYPGHEKEEDELGDLLEVDELFLLDRRGLESIR
jgi:hypothetical protein